MRYYSSPLEFFRDTQNAMSNIQKIDAIIGALYVAAAASAAGENLTQYSLNDGQTIISATPRSAKQIADSIKAWEGLKNGELQKITGRVFRLVDGKNFTGRHGC